MHIGDSTSLVIRRRREADHAVACFEHPAVISGNPPGIKNEFEWSSRQLGLTGSTFTTYIYYHDQTPRTKLLKSINSDCLTALILITTSLAVPIFFFVYERCRNQDGSLWKRCRLQRIRVPVTPQGNYSGVEGSRRRLMGSVISSVFQAVVYNRYAQAHHDNIRRATSLSTPHQYWQLYPDLLFNEVFCLFTLSLPGFNSSILLDCNAI